MMLLDRLIFLVLAWYFGASRLWRAEVRRAARPWYFPFLPSTHLAVPPAKVEDGDGSLLRGLPC